MSHHISSMRGSPGSELWRLRIQLVCFAIQSLRFRGDDLEVCGKERLKREFAIHESKSAFLLGSRMLFHKFARKLLHIFLDILPTRDSPSSGAATAHLLDACPLI